MKGKTFPGEVTVNVANTPDFEDKNSAAYQNLHATVTEFFQDVFTNADYGQTVILKVSTSPSLSARSEVRAGNDAVHVKVINIFSQNSSANASTVSNAIEAAIANSDIIATYSGQDLCDYYGCVKQNDQDDCSDGLSCVCKDGLGRPNPLVGFCLAKCPDDCNAENNKQCLMTQEDQSPSCTCLPGYKDDGRGSCEKCAFGYSGVGCKDPFQLVLTIVGTIAAVLILSLVVAVICCTRSKNKRKNIEEQNLIDNDFQSLKLQQTGFINMGADGSLFPKARTGPPRSVQPQNPYANQRGLPFPDY
uniref:SEA domain-containing protein n=2 Tax=Oryctolagus cuniculus TaxID=9986 RepID=G1T7R9_RABIT